MSKSTEEHAENWDPRHADFKDNDFLYDVFGAGVHRFLGSNLARLEFEVGVEQVLARIRFHGIPVVFTPGKRTAQ
jgi:cytochrome P450